MSSKKSTKKSGKGPSQEEIVAQFNQLRQEQRSLMGKLAELEGDQNEHRLVIETLNETSEDRKCFRMVGGILVERTVKDVLPALKHNKDQIDKLVDSLKKQAEKKGLEIVEFREKHNIRVRGEDAFEKKSDETKDSSSQGVLVTKGT